MQYMDSFGSTRGGWFFNISSLQIGKNTPVFFTSSIEPYRVMLVNERDVGINFITNRPEYATWFVSNLTSKFNKTLGTKCYS